MTAIFYDSICFCGNKTTQDWMATVFIRDGKWTLEYRFRYYDPVEPDKVWDSNDTKNWYVFQAKDASAETLADIRRTLDKLKLIIAAKMGQPVDTVELQCNDSDAKFFFEFGSRPWVHMKMQSAEETKGGES